MDGIASLMFMGVDPGTHFLGVAVITGDLEYVNAKVIRPVSDRSQIQDRIQNIGGQLADFLSLYPLLGSAAVEEPFLRGSVANSALAVTGAYWRTIFTLQESGHRVFVAKPAQLKSLAGRGNADKNYMIEAARQYFSLLDHPSEHVADALWAAVHARNEFMNGGMSNVQKTQPARRPSVKLR